jgi:hypothetical protein
MPKISVTEAEYFPPFVGVRLGSLRNFGGTLHNLYDSHRFDNHYSRSRLGHNRTKKDFKINHRKNYKLWQYQTKTMEDYMHP